MPVTQAGFYPIYCVCGGTTHCLQECWAYVHQIRTLPFSSPACHKESSCICLHMIKHASVWLSFRFHTLLLLALREGIPPRFCWEPAFTRLGIFRWYCIPFDLSKIYWGTFAYTWVNTHVLLHVGFHRVLKIFLFSYQLITFTTHPLVGPNPQFVNHWSKKHADRALVFLSQFLWINMAFRRKLTAKMKFPFRCYEQEKLS